MIQMFATASLTGSRQAYSSLNARPLLNKAIAQQLNLLAPYPLILAGLCLYDLGWLEI
jgi:hypothetical protein